MKFKTTEIHAEFDEFYKVYLSNAILLYRISKASGRMFSIDGYDFDEAAKEVGHTRVLTTTKEYKVVEEDSDKKYSFDHFDVVGDILKIYSLRTYRQSDAKNSNSKQYTFSNDILGKKCTVYWKCDALEQRKAEMRARLKVVL